jgi:hypothetical protein
VTRALQADLETKKTVARMLSNRKPLILNWFKVKGQLSCGALEGMNLKAKLSMRKAYGFKTLKCFEIALYHTLGAPPEPAYHHRFCWRAKLFNLNYPSSIPAPISLQNG